MTEAGVEVDRGGTVGCQHGWEYDMEGYHVSLTVEQDWVIRIFRNIYYRIRYFDNHFIFTKIDKNIGKKSHQIYN